MSDDANAAFLAQIRRGQQPLPPVADEPTPEPIETNAETKRGPGRPKGARNKSWNGEERDRRAGLSISDETWERMRILAIRRRTTVTALLLEGLQYVLKKYSASSIAGKATQDDVDDEGLT